MKLAVPLMLATTAALAAIGYANVKMGDDSIVPTPESQPYVAPTDNSTMSAPPAEESIAAPADTTAQPVQHSARESVTVTAPRPSNDELLRNAVMDRLSGDARLQGRIGVEAYQHTVSLTGRVMSTNQVDRAESLARGVDGVRDVNNYITARVGNS
jgi:osmotically-inducible protein OsmY